MRQKVKGEVYFIKCREFYKIGATKDLKNRFNSISTANPIECVLIHALKTNDMFLTEKLFKSMFSRTNKKGEWFELRETDIDYIKSGVYTKAIHKSMGNTKEWTQIPSVLLVT